ncbi:flavin reductase family protein [Rhizosphaericola mali]|uniref:2Fe-2S iron-sulfur cluster binding domain-containing protein n=1 Tax=Rhizosphaericola mali TaxID=2545455 RepID=A0A5P2G314_9BACT|nr:FAD-binding oxidoreductase [Rhizosphaericola mali]QES88212.1 2Fe-2S iron-sulfur cluster binding domain-containing protein [Rhizosphaericola mali]
MYSLKVTHIIPEVNDNLIFLLENVDRQKIPFKAGQFITLLFQFNGKEVRRSYSLVNSPYLDEPITIAVKAVENGLISQHLHHKIAVEDIVQCNTPQGQCIYVPELEKGKTIFLFAAGIGITPLFSIMKTALTQDPSAKVYLIYSNSSIEKTPFLADLKDWESKYHDQLTIIWIFSSSKNLSKAHLNRDYLLDIIASYAPKNKDDAIFYTCGPIIYMDLCKFVLLGAGYDSASIRKETFLLPEDEMDEDDTTEKVIDKNTYNIELRFEGKIYHLDIPYDHSILDVALKNKIALPYSCRSGMCSTCVSNCISGNVRMDYNEILTEDEIVNGRILICTGHPTQDKTIIEV